MRKVSFLILILAGTLFACKKESISPANDSGSISGQTINAVDLPLKATDYISNNFPAESINSVKKINGTSTTYLVTLNSAEQLPFDEVGNFTGTIDGIVDKPTGQGIVLNATAVSFLPSSIGAYISANYTGYSIRSAEILTVCPIDIYGRIEKVYEVFLVERGALPLKVIFKPDGTFLGSSVRVAAIDLPQPILEYLAKNFPGYSIRSMMDRITLANGGYLYNVFIVVGGKQYNILLDESGTALCVK